MQIRYYSCDFEILDTQVMPIHTLPSSFSRQGSTLSVSPIIFPPARISDPKNVVVSVLQISDHLLHPSCNRSRIQAYHVDLTAPQTILLALLPLRRRSLSLNTPQCTRYNLNQPLLITQGPLQAMLSAGERQPPNFSMQCEGNWYRS